MNRGMEEDKFYCALIGALIIGIGACSGMPSTSICGWILRGIWILLLIVVFTGPWLLPPRFDWLFHMPGLILPFITPMLVVGFGYQIVA